MAEGVAADYLRLTLEAGTYEEGYIDAYYGPEDAKSEAETERRPREDLVREAQAMVRAIDHFLERPDLAATNPEPAYSPRRRLIALRGALVAAETRLRMVGGERLSFADEANGLFGVRPEPLPLTRYDPILARLDTLIPGTGPLAARVDAFNERYTIPSDRLRPVFDAAIAECRRRTAQHIALPEGEAFTMAFVTGKTWSGYNYYLGNYQSRIEINTDLPIRISRAIDLGCHEGYPGHHVLNLLIEQRMARGGATGANGAAGSPWREYLVNPLYSPLSVLSEGSANYGIELAFPGPERLTFERDVLYPLAGLDPATADAYWRVQQATEALGGARLTIAKLYSRWHYRPPAGGRTHPAIFVAERGEGRAIGCIHGPVSQLCPELWLGTRSGAAFHRGGRCRCGDTVAADGTDHERADGSRRSTTSLISLELRTGDFSTIFTMPSRAVPSCGGHKVSTMSKSEAGT